MSWKIASSCSTVILPKFELPNSIGFIVNDKKYWGKNWQPNLVTLSPRIGWNINGGKNIFTKCKRSG